MITLQQVSDSNNGLIPRVATLAQRYTHDEVLALLMEMGESPQAAATMLAIETGQSLGHVAWASGDRADAEFEEQEVKRNAKGQFAKKQSSEPSKPQTFNRERTANYSPAVSARIDAGEGVAIALLGNGKSAKTIEKVAREVPLIHRAMKANRAAVSNGVIPKARAQVIENGLLAQIAETAKDPDVIAACDELRQRYQEQYGMSAEEASEYVEQQSPTKIMMSYSDGSDLEKIYQEEIPAAYKAFVQEVGLDPKVKRIVINRGKTGSYYKPGADDSDPGFISIAAPEITPSRSFIQYTSQCKTFHEMGHALDRNLGGDETLKQFIFDRRDKRLDAFAQFTARDESGQKIRVHQLQKYYSDQRSEVMGVIDTWIDPYVGRLYREEDRGRIAASYDYRTPIKLRPVSNEVFSMGLERFSNASNTAALLAHDPDHLFMVLGTLDHYRKNQQVSPRTDADELPETPQALEVDLAEAIVEASQPIIAERIEDLQALVSKAKGYDNLRENLPLAYDSFTREKWTQAIYEVFMRANLIGRLQVNEEVAEPERSEVVKPLNSKIAILENSDLANNRNDAIAGYLKQPFAEAMEYLRRKVSVPTESWRSLTAEQHDIAYTIAGLTDANLLEDVRWLIIHSEEEGLGFDEFKRMFKRLIGRKGWRPGPEPVEGTEDWRLRVAFETPVRRAISAGRNQQIQAIISKPKGLEMMPGRMWFHTSTPERYRREYPNARLHHLALHRQVFPSDHSFWAIASPSCNYLCRCHSALVPAWKIKRDGITINRNPPDPKTIAGRGFRRSAGMVPKAEQRQAAAAVLPTLSPDIRQRVRRDFREKGIL